MNKLKKIGIGLGIIIGIFFALIIAAAISVAMDRANMTPEELQQLEDKRAVEALQKEMDEKQAEAILEKSETTQDELENVKPIRIEDLAEKYQEETKLDTEEKVLEFIQNYKGTDNAGPTLARTFEMISVVSYPDEDIFRSPSTTVSLFATPDYGQEVINKYWNVELEIQTYRETSYFKWVVDTETNLVYPGNDEGKEILDILDITGE